MRFFESLSLVLAAATSVAALPSGSDNGNNGKKCLCKADHDELIEAYRGMLSQWSDDYIKYLADDFVDYSNSINSLAGKPENTPTFPTKQSFIDKQHVAVGAPKTCPLHRNIIC